MENMEHILEKIYSDSSLGEINVGELEKQLDLELEKPNPDYDLVEELTAAIFEVKGKDVKEIDVQSAIRTIMQRAENETKHFRFPKLAAAVSAACLLLIGVNTVSVAAWGTNIFSAIVQFTKGDVTIDLGKQEQTVISLPTSENDPYGIKSKCAEYDVFPQTMFYLPDGFELVDFYAEINEAFSDICFFSGLGRGMFREEE